MSTASKTSPTSPNGKKPTKVLVIIDGFGYNADSEYNAIANAKAPNWQRYWHEQPKTLIGTSGMAVGLPEGQMGNSEVGHMTLGAGRVVYQNFTRINKAIEDGDFFKNPAYLTAIQKVKEKNAALHIIGLLSDGGVHAHEDHILAMIQMAADEGLEKVYLHAFLDGRDTPPRSAEDSLRKADALFEKIGRGGIASICGRFFAMDRDSRWDRVQSAYDLIAHGKSSHRASSSLEGLALAYERGENDEFVSPTLICGTGRSPAQVHSDDAIVCMNFRPDRSRQLTAAFINEDFHGFDRGERPILSDYVMTTEYSSDLDCSCAFPPEDLKDSFGEVLAKQNMTQLRIAETEKYAHVTFFFSGGQEDEFAGEDRILVPSPKVATYDLQPEMSAAEVTQKLVAAIESGKYDAIICNYANCDQVGHSGVYDAAVKAVETVDACLASVEEAVKKVGGEMLVTADHGNVEIMFDTKSKQAHTQHTTLPVPLIYVGPHTLTLEDGGSLADVAPTLLDMLGVEQPEAMKGRSLIKRSQAS